LVDLVLRRNPKIKDEEYNTSVYINGKYFLGYIKTSNFVLDNYILTDYNTKFISKNSLTSSKEDAFNSFFERCKRLGKEIRLINEI
jgi:hypothetical protein